jgi:hypothetical protein
VDLHKVVEDCILGSDAPLPDTISHYQTWLQQLRGADAFPEHKVAINSRWESTSWDSPDVFLRGVLDLKHTADPATINVYDWKSGKIYDDHEDQRRLYSAFTFAEHPDAYQVRASHVYLDLGKVVSVDYHRDQMGAIRDNWDRRAAIVLGDTDYIPSPGYHCRWCSYSKANGGLCRF